jgi:hypothetical protein
MNAAQRPPGEPSYGDGWRTGLRQRRAIDEDPERKPAAPNRQPEREKEGRDRTRQLLAPGVVADQIQHAFVIHGIDVYELGFPSVRSVSGEDSGTNQPELLRPGDENPQARRRCRLGRGQGRDHAGSVVPGTLRASLEPPAPRKKSCEQSRAASEAQPGGGQAAIQASNSHQGETHNRYPGDPDGNQAARHGMRLRLRVQMGHNPPPGPVAWAGGNQVGVFPGPLAQRNPAEAEAGPDEAEHADATGPNRQSCPRGNIGRAEQGKQDEGQQSETIAEQRKRFQAGRGKAELLEDDLVTEPPEVSRNQLSRRCGLRGTGLARKRQDLAGDLLQRRHPWLAAQDEAACLDPRRELTSWGATVANAARLVSSVI